MSTKLVKDIVEELFAMDKSLIEHKKDVEKVVELMVSQKPQWTPDTKFVQELSERLNLVSSSTSDISFLHKLKQSLNMNKKPVYAGASVLAIASIALVLVSNTGQQSLPGYTRFEMLDVAAFGSLGQIAENNSTAQPNISSLSATAETGFGGGGALTSSQIEPRIGILPYPSTRIEYTYVGEDFELPTSADYPVYRYESNTTHAKDIASAISGLKLSLPLKSLSNLHVNTIELSEEKERGYTIYMNFYSGQHHMNLYYPSWPELQCENGCEYKQFTEDTIPSDDRLISLANNFLSEKKIDTSIYGDPVLTKEWRLYQIPESKLVPTVVRVVYPLELPSGQTYEQNGVPHGMSVNINLQHNIVDSVNSVFTGKFSGSRYDLTTSVEDVLKVASNGAQRGGMWFPPGTDVKNITLKLDTPEIRYVQYHAPELREAESSTFMNRGSNMYIPALMFPVINDNSDLRGVPEYISVPLVREIINGYLERPDDVIMELPVEPILLDSASLNKVAPDIQEHVDSKSNFINVKSPQIGDEISSPLIISGRARGTWFFEGSFPITIVDWDGRIIKESYATAVLNPNDPESTWMTEEFVPFYAEIPFEVGEDVLATNTRGTIILKKANPSDLSENDDALEIPITFAK